MYYVYYSIGATIWPALTFNAIEVKW